MLLSNNIDKKSKSSHTSLDDITQQMEYCNDGTSEDGDAQLDSSLDEAEEVISTSPKRNADIECISEGIIDHLEYHKWITL